MSGGASAGWLGRYRAERILGTGGFATVWLAVDETLDAQVALKVLAENWAHDPDVRRRFTEEARILWRLDSEHIVRVYTVDDLPDGRPFFVMEYADNGSLEDRMRARQEPMPVADAVILSRSIAEALATAHARGVVHRDLKPSNVLFKGDRMLLADFGIARSLEAAGATTIAAGTPHYMAPEQTEGRADRSSDVYSAAVILYELLAGTVPFPYPTAGQVIRAQLTESAPDIRTKRPDVPPALAATLARGLDRDPERRHPTAEAWRDDLSGETGPPEVPAAPVPVPGSAGETLGPEDIAAIRATPVPPVPPTAPPPPPPVTPSATPPAPPPPPPPPSPDRRRRRRRQTLAALLAVVVLAGGIVGISLATAGTAAASIQRAPAGELGTNPFGALLKPTSALKPPSLLPFLNPFIKKGIPKPSTPKTLPSFPGSTPGLYGGTQKLTVCDAKALVTFLTTNPDKAAAWAAVQGITLGRIPEYVAGLTDAILRTDTRVTNHGFANGKATTIPSVLQAGTAVLVDIFGVPRVRCFCGNPLSIPDKPKPTTKFTGPSWPGFDPAEQAVITKVTEVTKLVIVDVLTGVPFLRPPGTQGEADVAAPPDVLAGSPFAPSAPPANPGGPPTAAAIPGTYTIGSSTQSPGCTAGTVPDLKGQQAYIKVSGSSVTVNLQGADVTAPFDPAAGTFSLTASDGSVFRGAFTNDAAGGVRLAATIQASGTCTLSLDSTRTGDATVPPTAATTVPPTTAAPAPVDITSQGTVAASSTFSGQFPASAAVDGNTGTSWFSIGAGDGSSSTFTWKAPTDFAIDSISVIGNEHNNDPANRSGFGYQGTEIIVLDSGGNVVFDNSFSGPSNSVNDIHTPVHATGRTVRLVLSQRESPDCGGFSELQITGSPA